nr:MAG TPA: hypothetical protein [Caudoviricetes sp.]
MPRGIACLFVFTIIQILSPHRYCNLWGVFYYVMLISLYRQAQTY